ncbi:MAG: hypothetical protein AAF790_14535 [Planctomycetota bacterium]
MTGPPASRFDNPFATCWTRPGALAWRGAGGHTLAGVLTRLDAVGGGQIVGPHGAGKTTLLEGLSEALGGRGEAVARWTINGRRDAEPPPCVKAGWLLLDGYEQLPAHAALLARLRCARRGARLVVTTHRRVAMPVLAELSPTAETAAQLFRGLTRRRPSRVTERDALASFCRHGGNLREVWFDLYDQHERHMRGDASPRTEAHGNA